MIPPMDVGARIEETLADAAPAAARRAAETPPVVRPIVPAACAAALVAAALAAYHGSFGCAFHFDDVQFLVENPDVRSLWPPAYLVKSLRPFAFASFAASHAVSGYEVWAWHAMNLAVHAASALVLFGFARRAFALPRVGLGERAALGSAFAIALLWTVHPLNTQAVVYVIQRAESMAALACLAALYALARTASADGARARRAWSAATVAAAWFGLGCKESAALVPLVLYLFDALVIEGSFASPLRHRRALYLGLALPYVALPLAWLLVAPNRFGWLLPSRDTPSPHEYVLAQGAVILRYLALVVRPVGLNFDHAWDPARHAGEIPWAAGAVAGVGALVAARVKRRAPAAWLGASFFLLLAPSSSFLPLSDRMVEHRMYLASAPCIALLVLGARSALAATRLPAAARQSAFAAAVGAAGVLLTLATIARVRVYETQRTLWEDVAAKAPHNARAHFNLGLAVLAESGDIDAALPHFERAAALEPGHAKARNNAGAIHYERGRYAEAEAHYRAACDFRPHPELLRSHANALLALGRTDEAVDALREAERLMEDEPASARARLLNDLAAAEARAGRRPEAIEHLAEAARLDAAVALPHLNLARLLAASGRPIDALDAYLRANAIEPDHVAVRIELLALVRAHGQDAQRHLVDVLRREPGNAAARRALELARR